MAELPEISKIAKQMDLTLSGKTISSFSAEQEKCINVPEEEFGGRIIGSVISGVRYKGKWFIVHLNNGENILISLGMGGDILYCADPSGTPERYQIRTEFSDGSVLTVGFWWFGRFLICSDRELKDEPNTKDIAADPFDESFTYGYFADLFKGKKGQIKAFMMNQRNIGGIGNAYMHDILFKAKLHPQRKIADMDGDDLRRLFDSVMSVLRNSEAKGAMAYENDLFGEKGRFTADDLFIGYKEGKPCPVCGTPVVRIRAGSTQSFVCTECQRL